MGGGADDASTQSDGGDGVNINIRTPSGSKFARSHQASTPPLEADHAVHLVRGFAPSAAANTAGATMLEVKFYPSKGFWI
ncbi:hypothetical protein RchiOBHm_Chr2g0097501 [Rosa chinensis]|uniref:Uncharacterized protein n=1 Tax=Rosa chinensis TaxID=74649 RepID=A0A2P6RLE0_ROSCH|nr:hypothetical protein RchiOBHm_Chr2g0097501 [Rosa chinensis]